MQGYLSSPYLPTYYELAQRHAEVPRLSGKQVEAIRLYNALALSDKLRLDILLQPGDIQLLSNHTQLHTRSAFVDHAVGTADVKICITVGVRAPVAGPGPLMAITVQCMGLWVPS
jgi:hypothetical protein